MNILHISPDFNYACGVSMHVYLLLKELSQHKEINLFFITNQGDSIERLKSINVKVHIIKFNRRNKNPFLLFKELFILYKFCSINKIDIIHTHHRYLELLSLLFSELYHIKTVSTVHSLVDKWKYISFKSNTVIAVSKAIQILLVDKYKVPSSKVVQLYNFVIPFEQHDQKIIDQFKVQIEMNEQDKIIMFIGRINYIKGFDVLVSAFQKVNLKKPTLKLLVVGEYESEEYRKIVLSSDRIIFVSKQDEIRKYYSLASIVVLPSRIDSFPFVMLESGLAKKPFIGGRTGGIEEFIEDGVDGLLVEPGNVEDLYLKMLYLINDANLQKKMGENLYKKVLPLTNKEAYIQHLVSLYEKLLHTNN